MTPRTVETRAAHGTMTLGELRAFVHDLEISGADGDTRIEGRTWRGGVKSLKATAARFADGERCP